MGWRDLPGIGNFLDWYRPLDNRGLIPIPPSMRMDEASQAPRRSAPVIASPPPERAAEIRLTRAERQKIYHLFQGFAPGMASPAQTSRTQEWLVGAFRAYQDALRTFPKETSWFFAHHVLPSLAPEKRVQAYHFWRDDPIVQKWGAVHTHDHRRMTLRMMAALDPAHTGPATRVLTDYDIKHPQGNRITATIAPTGQKGTLEMGIVSLSRTPKGAVFVGNAQELSAHWRNAGSARDPQSIALADAFWISVSRYPLDPAARQMVLSAARAIDIRPAALQPRPWGVAA